MNTRVLELIKNPKIIIESDLKILESESEKMPYAQSIRALYLYGINLYQSEKYKENLSKTAAYTTDKKILYQFINSEKISKKEITSTQIEPEETAHNQTINNTETEVVKPAESEIVTEIEKTETQSVINQFDIDKTIENESEKNSEFVVLENEENSVEEKNHKIDSQPTKEPEIVLVKDDLEIKDNLIVIDENRSEETISEHKTVEEVLETTEEKTTEPITETQVQDEDSSGNISFNGIEDFLPQVKFSVPKNHLDYLNPPKREIKKEVQQPIQEIPVAKIEYAEPVVPEIAENEIDNSQVSFENTQTLEISKPTKVVEVESEIDENICEDEISFENTQSFEVSKPEEPVIVAKIQEQEIISKKVKVDEQPISEWKPMSFSANIPDALIGKTTEAEKQPEVESIVEEKTAEPEIKEEIIINEKPIVEEKPQILETERPVMNVSFFGNEVSRIEEKEKEIPAIIEKPEAKEIPDSNVGTFINTWQSWLKIERKETAEKQAKVKEKIIDNFIETNPKISQLKEESNYVVKEKKDDISHLMTETLARLYTEQKLYTKAIKAYEILSEKHPHKKDYFEEKIEEVKEIRKS